MNKTKESLVFSSPCLREKVKQNQEKNDPSSTKTYWNSLSSYPAGRLQFHMDVLYYALVI